MKYTKVIIKSKDDLPKEKERYIAHMKYTDSIRYYPYYGTKVSTKLWIEGIDWYLIEDTEPSYPEPFLEWIRTCSTLDLTLNDWVIHKITTNDLYEYWLNEIKDK